MIVEKQIDQVFAVLGVPRELLCRRVRWSWFARQRALAAGLLSDVLGLTAQEIADTLGRASHATALDLIHRAQHPDLADDLADLAARLRARLAPPDL